MGRNSINDNKSNQKTKNTVRKPNKNESTVREKKKDVQNSKPRKKIWSFDALVEAMRPTPEELDFRREKNTALNAVETYSKLFKCTKCQRNLKASIEQTKRAPVHPCLGVLMCDRCRDYYEDGEFSLDSDGEDKYCRWCGEGGTIFTCSKCICGFCANCIKCHFSLKFFKSVKDDENWHCFFCNPKPLWFQRYVCSLAVKMSEGADTPVSPAINTNKQEDGTVLTGKSGSNRKRLYEYSSSSDETDCEAPKSPLKKFKFTSNPLRNLVKDMERNSFKNVKPLVLPELQKLLKLSEYQMSFGVTWCHDTLKKLAKLDCKVTEKELVDECKKIKWFLTVLSTYLVQFCNSVDSLEKSLCQEEGQTVSSDFAEKHQSPYTTILQFLDFVNNQVKTFMQRGISFPDILEATVYDDEKVIGLKKKTSFEENRADPVTNESVLMNEDNTEDDLSRGEGSLVIETDQNNESSFIESDNSSPCITFRETNSNVSDSAQEIQKLLSILENA